MGWMGGRKGRRGIERGRVGGYVRIWGRWHSVGGGFHKRLDVVSMYRPSLP